MSNVIRVIAAVVDQHQLTLYKEDGSEHIIKQGDPELRRVLEIVMPIIQDGEIAEVDLTTNADKGKEYKDFEAKTNGFVKFFKVLKAEAEKFLEQLAGATEAVAPITVGVVPTNNPAVSRVEVKRKDSASADQAKEKQSQAVAEILSHAVPTSSASFSAPMADQHNEKGMLVSEGSETMIAVIGDQIVPGVEKLAGQLEYANKAGNSTVGMERFLARLAAVINERGHSVQDLLKFLERGDLPIADDGSFVAYKILRKNGDSFVDCHTQKVPQRVGSYVHMDSSMVDKNRRNECSNGLHVARRGYIRHFSGDVCTLIKVNPEDVIAVPEYDANKMRVCGYHIIDLISESDYQSLRNDNTMTDNMAAKIQLGKALAGDHIGITERVKIGGQLGTDVVVTAVVHKAQAKKAVAKQKTSTKRLAGEVKVKKVVHGEKDAAVDAKAIAKRVDTDKASGGSARQIKAIELLSAVDAAPTPREAYAAALALVAFKKATKVSWDKLGISMFSADRVVGIAATDPTVFDVIEVPAPAVTKVRKAKVKAVGQKKLADVVLDKLTPKQKEVADLYDKVLKGDKKAAAELLTKKKASKKSWDALGLPKQAGEDCEKLLAKAKQ